MAQYLDSHGNRSTSQTESIPGRTDQVENSAGGYVFALDDWKRLHRFLILGSEGGTYYVGQRKLTRENAEAVLRCLKADGARVVEAIVDVSEHGRAPSNDPALFALAMACSADDVKVRRLAIEAIPRVVRIGTHLFHFLAYAKQWRGWGSLLKRGVARWYERLPYDDLAYLLLKYKQRDGWSHADAIRLSHPKAPKVGGGPFNDLMQFALKGSPTNFARIQAAESLKTLPVADVGIVIRKHKLPREVVPPELLNNPKVWSALLDDMPLGAMIRNLGKMTAIGLLKPMVAEVSHVTNMLSNKVRLSHARIHPIAILSSLRTYASGEGFRGSLQWDPVNAIQEALDDAFHLAFECVEPTNKRWLLALDVSGSMDCGMIAGIAGLTPREGAAALAMQIARTEQHHQVMAFSDRFVPLNITARSSLTEAMAATANLPFSGTDCALPMRYALNEKMPVDVFCIITDSETWVGGIHPCQALQEYRRKMGIGSKLIVIAMTSTGFTIADPEDAGMLDIVGFDAACPQVMADFVLQ